jgi:hypothetical protein
LPSAYTSCDVCIHVFIKTKWKLKMRFAHFEQGQLTILPRRGYCVKHCQHNDLVVLCLPAVHLFC